MNEMNDVRRRSPDRAVVFDRQVSAVRIHGETFGRNLCGVGRPSHNNAWLLFVLLLALGAAGNLFADTNLTVAADGSGQFTTVQAAINAAPQTTNPTNRCTIHIKPGVYKEVIYVQREKHFVRLLGEDPEKTVLTYNLNANLPGNDGRPIGTFRTPSTYIDADDFSAENVTFENSAGPVGQALAIRVDGDRVAFRNCRFLGWQDTILINRGRHYFEGCYIAGHVDFIFGGATAFFEKCHIHGLRNGYVTAASTPEKEPFGYVFSNCKITGESPEVKTYLGRPWRPFASVTYLNTEMSDVVRPVGWDNWRDPAREKTSRYAEFNSTGPGAVSTGRVAWARQLTKSEAEAITVQKVLAGVDGWNPQADLAQATASARAAAAVESAFTNVVARIKAAGATVTADIEYGRAGDESLRLDACAPEGNGPFPVALIVHGGGWSSGDKEQDVTVLFEPLTNAKFTWFSMNYRLAPKHRWPACLDDVETAIRWVKAHAAEYKGDPKRIALFGYSAGGQLVCMAAVRADETTRVQAVVGLAPPTDQVADSERRGAMSSSMTNLLNRVAGTLDDDARAALRQLSPLNFVKPGMPPFLLVHGTEDKSVPYTQSVNFRAKLDQIGVPCELVTIKGAQHRITEWGVFDAKYKETIVAWLNQTLRPGESAAPAPGASTSVKVFDVRQFGATGDGKTLDTVAIQKALDECGNAGGGIVRLAAGTYLCKPISLRSGTTLQLDAGAVLQATDERADFEIPGRTNSFTAFVSGRDLHDVAIVGQGTIDGAGAKWWGPAEEARIKNPGYTLPRPNMVVLTGCKNVRLENVTLQNSPKFHLVPTDCDGVIISNVTVTAPAGAANTDAIDPSVCRNVLITHCRIDVGDDNVAIKSGRKIAGREFACENITVTDCVFLHGHGMSIGSESIGGVRNVTVRNCTFEGTENGIRIKSQRGRGGVVENISYSDITMKNVDPAITLTCYYMFSSAGDPVQRANPKEDAAQPVTETTPIYRNIRIRNLTATCQKSAGMILGLPESQISDVVLENVRITSATTGLTIRNAKGIQLKNVQVTPKDGPPIIAENAQVDGLKEAAATGSK